MSSAITSIPPPPTDQQEKKEEEYDEVKYLDIVYRQEMELLAAKKEILTEIINDVVDSESETYANAQAQLDRVERSLQVNPCYYHQHRYSRR